MEQTQSVHRFSYNSDTGEQSIWGLDGIFYPPSGFYVDLPNNNSTAALALAQNLQQNGWVTKGTRMIFVTFTGTYLVLLLNDLLSVQCQLNGIFCYRPI